MFSKITPASVCICNHPPAIYQAKPPSHSFDAAAIHKMIDTQINHLHHHNNQHAGKIAESIAARNERNSKAPEDVNCNMSPQTVPPSSAIADDGVINGDLTKQPHQKEEEEMPPTNGVRREGGGGGYAAMTPACIGNIAGVNAKLSPKTLDVRKEEVMAIRNRFPTKVPIIVQRFCKETALPQLDKSKYLVPQEITMSQFLTIIRNRMRISSTQTLYLLVNNRSMISLSLTLAEVYNEYAGVDGFLYVTYASQEVFGGC